MEQDNKYYENETNILSFRDNLQHLPELLVMIIDKDGKMDCVFRNSSFRDHADALNYLYNNKIKKWYQKSVNSRERSVYEYLISNKNNFVFLNTGEGIILGGIVYIPNEMTDLQYDSIKYYDNSLNQFRLIAIQKEEEYCFEKNEFSIDNFRGKVR